MFNLINKYTCGFIFKNLDDFTNKIVELIDNPQKLKKLKANSYKLYRTEFDGAQIYKNFETYLNNFK